MRGPRRVRWEGQRRRELPRPPILAPSFTSHEGGVRMGGRGSIEIGWLLRRSIDIGCRRKDPVCV
jgi:hypothetical protein